MGLTRGLSNKYLQNSDSNMILITIIRTTEINKKDALTMSTDSHKWKAKQVENKIEGKRKMLLLTFYYERKHFFG